MCNRDQHLFKAGLYSRKYDIIPTGGSSEVSTKYVTSMGSVHVGVINSVYDEPCNY